MLCGYSQLIISKRFSFSFLLQFIWLGIIVLNGMCLDDSFGIVEKESILEKHL